MKNSILAIETSCDDTSASVISDGIIKSNIVSSQIDHIKLGGVVPEIASRAHQKNIIYIVEKALEEAATSRKKLDAIAFTLGPGLLGSLLVGSTFSKSFGYALNIPIIGVNHLKAHAFSHTINKKKITYPFVSLLVSGGHTQIILIKSYDNMKIIGETRDDAVGEAFDK
ncbi:MAG: tRNA (adenosine(37)-N6)-threonylcarbamoyltransferase complex transferase subunit TsaD, partial [Bacteroidota bacterium]|nr:tRNA (adenosine(37)-N6)-threonylcarbamoyltransferase complex transferase subunit TsaD [Bacteroidota bacterium]